MAVAPTVHAIASDLEAAAVVDDLAQPQYCILCQLKWTGPASSFATHELGKTHKKRLRNPRLPLLEQGVMHHSGNVADDLDGAQRSGPTVPVWVRFARDHRGARGVPADLAVPLWPWPGTGAAYEEVAGSFVRRLCALRKGALDELLQASGNQDTSNPSDMGNIQESGCTGTQPSELRRCRREAAAIQERMRTCQQQPDDFADAEALWGYAAAKFPLRSGMAFRAINNPACPDLQKLFCGAAVRVAAFGGGPAAEIFGAVVARDILGGEKGRSFVYEWVDGWRPIVTQVGALLEEDIEYCHCDVMRPLSDEANSALLLPSRDFDIAIFSHVLLECSRGGQADPLVLFRDLWAHRPSMSHALILDAGQARGKDKRSRPLAGSLRSAEDFAESLGIRPIRIEGKFRTEGVLLSRARTA